MNYLFDIIKGIFIGIANIIPGVSGGTMALSMGIYDKLIGAVSNFFKDWKKSLVILFPILIGCGIGFVGFTFLIEYLLVNQTYGTCMAFVGLILGGIPMLIKKLKQQTACTGKGLGIGSVLCFLILFAVSVGFPLLSSDQETMRTLTAAPSTMVILFFIGIIAAATMVIPGVSGSLILMILGYYYGIIEAIKGFLEALKNFDIPGLTQGFLLLCPLGIGIILGIFLIAKLITFLFERYGVQTYCSILGLIAASPFAIFYNTGLLDSMGGLSLMQILAGIVLAAGGAVLTFQLGEK